MIRRLGAALGEEVEVLAAQALEEAVPLYDQTPELVVLCYAFDELRPYRFLHRIHEKRKPVRIPVILVRALPVPLGRDESELRESYQALGVEDFVNFSEQVDREGVGKALKHFRDVAFSRMRWIA